MDVLGLEIVQVLRRERRLLGQIGQPAVREPIVDEIQNPVDGRVTWSEDLMRLTLAGAHVSAGERRPG